MLGKVVGIDLGQTYARVAAWENGEAALISNADREKATPCVVAFSRAGKVLVGQAAERQTLTNPDRTISLIQYELGSDAVVTIDGQTYRPQEIAAVILRSLKQDAEAHFEEAAGKAVIAVPASYDSEQRQAVVEAAKIAGIEVENLLSRPVAATLALGGGQGSGTILALDLGGGTFGVSIIKSSTGALEVIATAGDNRLGAEDFDNRIVSWMADQFYASNSVDLRADKVAFERMREAAKKVREQLTDQDEVQIHLPFIAVDDDGPQHLDATLTKARFNELTADLVQKVQDLTLGAVADAKIELSDIDRVILAGGASSIQAVRDMVAWASGKQPIGSDPPTDSAAIGAAQAAAMLNGEVKTVAITDVTPFALEVIVQGAQQRLVEPNTPVPVKKSETARVSPGDKGLICVQQGADALFTASEQTFASEQPIDVTIECEIDKNGLAHLRAIRGENSVSLMASSHMSDGDIEKAADWIKTVLKDRDQFANVLPRVRSISERDIKRSYASYGASSVPSAPTRTIPLATITTPTGPMQIYAAAAGPSADLEKAVLAMLPVLDNLERAGATACSDANYAQGVHMITRQFHDALESLEVSEIDTSGVFDPNVHHAVMQVEDDNFASNQIVETVLKGYRLKNKVIRPAMVKVAK